MEMENELNIIKKVKEDLGITYDELGNLIGFKGDTLKTIANNSKGEISINVKKSIQLLLENIELKIEIQKVEEFKKSLKEIVESIKK